MAHERSRQPIDALPETFTVSIPEYNERFRRPMRFPISDRPDSNG